MKELEKQNPKMFNAESLKLEKRGNLYGLYLKLQKPLVLDVKNYDYSTHREKADAWMEYSEEANNVNADSIILENAMDNQLKTGLRESTVYLFRNSNQAKSSDVITYDNDGEVIPLLERPAKNSASFNIAMTDRETAERLEAKKPAPSFDGLLKDKMLAVHMIEEHEKYCSS